jgi:hypothetical protein
MLDLLAEILEREIEMQRSRIGFDESARVVPLGGIGWFEEGHRAASFGHSSVVRSDALQFPSRSRATSTCQGRQHTGQSST